MTTDTSHAVSLQAWAAEAEAAAGIARAVAPTAFVPEQLRRWVNPDERDPRKRQLDYEGTVATVTAVLLAGQELGLGPMASLRSFTIIRGTVAMYAIAARALLQQHGHEIVVKDSTSQRAVVDGRRRGGEWQRSTWDLDRAKTARLFPGPENGNWRTQTKAMLVARATAEVARWVASDALLGLPVLAEELDDAPDDGQVRYAITSVATGPEGPAPPGNGSVPAEVEPGKATARRRAPKARAALPKAGDGLPPPAPPEPPPDAPPPDQPPADIPADPLPAKARLVPKARARILAGLRTMGVTGRDESLALIGAWVGHPVDTTNDLTPEEASVIIDRIDSLLSLGARTTDPQDAAEDGDPGPDDNPDQLVLGDDDAPDDVPPDDQEPA